MAGLGRASYTALAVRRQSRRPQSRSAIIAVLALASTTLAGCSTIMMPLSGWGSSPSGPPAGEITTGSVPRPPAARPAPESDGEVVRRTVEAAARGSATGGIAWSNPASGHSGTITDLVVAKAANGAPCRDFATTLATVEGVTLHRGRACQGYAGPWELLDFAPADPNPAG